MSRAQLRILFLLPVIFGVAGAFGFFGGQTAWPEPAQAYFQWYLNQPLPPTGFFLNRAAAIGLLGLLLSTAGLLIFWSPARYIYLASLLLTFLGEVPDVPVLVGGWGKLLEVWAQTLIGVNLALIFFSPGKQYFSSSSKAP